MEFVFHFAIYYFEKNLSLWEKFSEKFSFHSNSFSGPKEHLSDTSVQTIWEVLE